MDLKQALTSRKAVIVYAVFSGLFVLTLIVDNLIMPWIVHSRSEMVIPNVVNTRADQGMEEIESAGCVPIIADTIPSQGVKRGFIAGQNPPAGSVVREGRNVYLSISGGEGDAVMPNLRGRSLRDATLSVEQAGLRMGMVTYETSNLPPETIISQSVPSGTVTHKNAAVDVVISTGQDKSLIDVPNLVGFALEEARNFLRDTKLRLGEISYRKSPDKRAGSIIEQAPAAGDRVDVNAPINVTVAK
jgi:serine/threonine-protein kinase